MKSDSHRHITRLLSIVVAILIASGALLLNTARPLSAEGEGFTLSTTTLSVSETGTGTFTAVLDVQPTSKVSLAVTSADTGEATVWPTSMGFYPDVCPHGWNSCDKCNSPRTVTITGVDDSVADGSQTTAVTIAVVDASSADAYDSVADQTVT
ncbi:MAG: hypothetical protein MK011_04460, partial [Dehalococcoidia bacterium]|nr:hypothetical protein [Dehalococcoidia bacterium]